MRYVLCVLAILLLNSRHAFSQQVSFEVGGRGGKVSEIPLERRLTGVGASFSSYKADAAPTVVGPSFALTYGDRFGAEVDVLYKSFDIHTSSIGGLSDGRVLRTESLTHARSWETTALFRYLFTKAPIRPFAIGGLSFPKMSGRTETRVTAYFTGEEISRSSSHGPVRIDGQTAGLVVGGGAEVKLERLRLVPEFRYIRCGNDSQSAVIVIPSNRFEILIGLRYRFGG